VGRHHRARLRVAKRAFDLMLAVLLIPLAVPLLLLCALAIYVEDPGPVVFRQLRTGLHGRRFRMFKFRTMVVNAEDLKASLQHLNILPPPDFKIIDDPRITRVGRVLRKTSLDELPQILNVIKGDMSFVGPRPTSFGAQTYSLWHTERLEVRPGITGLWQVTGRNRMTFDERLRLDIAYVRSMSLRRDLAILLRTVFAAFSGTGA
jgi:lipopolysaccharide/colanic/teichoic acid biosynthesis glycosyltransferase